MRAGESQVNPLRLFEHDYRGVAFPEVRAKADLADGDADVVLAIVTADFEQVQVLSLGPFHARSQPTQKRIAGARQEEEAALDKSKAPIGMRSWHLKNARSLEAVAEAEGVRVGG